MVSGQVNLIINTRENYFVLPCLLIGSEQYDVRSEIKVILGEGRYCTLIECKPPVVWAFWFFLNKENVLYNICAKMHGKHGHKTFRWYSILKEQNKCKLTSTPRQP